MLLLLSFAVAAFCSGSFTAAPSAIQTHFTRFLRRATVTAVSFVVPVVAVVVLLVAIVIVLVVIVQSC